MLINLSEVFSTSGKATEVIVPIEKGAYDFGLGEKIITAADDMKLCIRNVKKGKALISGVFSVTFKAECDRCLKETEVRLDIEVSRFCSDPDYEGDEEEDDLRDLMEGYQLDTDLLLHDEITVNWPVKILCQDDCKGLCPVCGQDLNEGDCGCDTFVPDPRMAAIFDKLKSTKEV